LKYSDYSYLSVSEGVTPSRTSVTVQVSVIAISAALFAVTKGLTAYVRTPWGVGQLFIAAFIPVFFAITADTLPAAIGAAAGSFLGDVLFLVPLGATTPFFALTVGAPANFIAVLLLSVFVKKYGSWSAFVAATVCFLTLGNLIAGALLVWLFPFPAQYMLGFTVYWDMTSIPAILIGVPVLVRATLPIIGRSKVLKFAPQWSNVGRRQVLVSLVFSLAFVALGGAIFLLAPDLVSFWPGLATYFALAAALVVVFGPVANVVVRQRPQAKQAAA
jgi:hypothetical protein